ncbi:MAG: hypothetical protein C0485_00690 [Pirellula sp.]|nr:hypothetical protein [Pirellula sp.]
MALVLQIVVLLVVLIGLITIIMSIKNWHWAQMVLALSIFFMSLATLFLGMETFRIHRNIRKAIPGLEQKLADVEEENRALQFGARNEDPAVMRIWTAEIFGGEPPYDAEAEGRMLSTSAWTTRLQDLARARGRVWRNAIPGAFNQKTNQIAVTIAPQQQAPPVDPDLAAAEPPADPAAAPAAAPAAPQGHGLTPDAIIYVFENGAPNPAAPDQGAQYIGEFKVVQANDVGVMLEPVQALNQFTGNRLVKSIQAAQQQKVTWSLYELMPADSHELFAKLDEAAKRSLLPAATVEEYLRQGTPATDDDDQYHRAAFDEAGNQIGADDAKADPSKVNQWRFDRPLRDYGYLFAEQMRERVVMEADVAALKQQIADLATAQANAKKLEAHRTSEKAVLAQDLNFMERDLAFVKKLLATINSQIANAKSQASDLLTANASMAQSLIDKQLAELKTIDERSPAPAQRSLLNAQ